MPSEKAVEAIILEAMQRGEFDNLPGKGKPIDLSAYFNTPEDVRLAYSLLKNAGVLPEEIEVLKEIEALKNQYDQASDESQQKRLQTEIDRRRLKFHFLMERLKNNTHHGHNA